MDGVKGLIEVACSVLILSHICPDPDSAGASIALAKALEQMGKAVQIGVQGNSNPQVDALLVHAKYELTTKPNYDVDLIIVLDTNSPLLFDFESVKKSRAKKILIDHHSTKPEIVKSFDATLINEEAVSVTQILFYLLEQLKVKSNYEIDLCLVAGIVTDSANFIAATPECFRVLWSILSRGNVSFQTVLNIISLPMDESEKIARLKGSQRMKIHRENGYIIITSHVSSFEGSVAKAILNLGADVAFVAAAKKGSIRISARAKSELVTRGMHLGRDILPTIIPLIQGDAGGHAAAAGANGVRDDKANEALRACVDATIAFIKKAD